MQSSTVNKTYPTSVDNCWNIHFDINEQRAPNTFQRFTVIWYHRKSIEGLIFWSVCMYVCVSIESRIEIQTLFNAKNKLHELIIIFCSISHNVMLTSTASIRWISAFHFKPFLLIWNVFIRGIIELILIPSSIDVLLKLLILGSV